MASAPQVAGSADENASDESLTGTASELAALRASTAGRTTARRPNRRGQAMREKLVQAAAECFREYGYTKTRISDIVHSAGTAQGNFYRHFSSLDEIFVAALEPALRELASSSNRRLPTSNERDALIAVNVTFFQAYSRNRHLLRVMREAAAVSGNDGFGRLWLRTRADFVDRTERWLRHLHDEGRIGPADFPLLAEALGCMTEQMAYVHIGLPAATPRPERIRQLGETVGEVWYRSLPPVS
jgi:AcrR family transcriptional regulator